MLDSVPLHHDATNACQKTTCREQDLQACLQNEEPI